MSNFQRGMYRPLADVLPIYHLAGEGPEEERSRAPLLVVIVLVVLAAFAGVVWLAYNGVEDGGQGVSLFITAPGPAVAAPATTGAGPAVAASRPTTPPAPAVARTAQAAKAAPPAAAPAATSLAVSGAAMLQLGAFESQALANGAWAAFRARYAMAANWASDVQRADLGSKGIMYRLRVGPFVDRAAATNVCVQLETTGANCFVAAP